MPAYIVELSFLKTFIVMRVGWRETPDTTKTDDHHRDSSTAAPCKIALFLLGLQHRRLRQLRHRLRASLLLIVLRARSSRSRGLSTRSTASDASPTPASRRRDRSVRVRPCESGGVVQREVLLRRYGALESRADGDAA
jgi:hypothetical protein